MVSENGGMEGKVVLITGGTSGVGKAVATALAAMGAEIRRDSGSEKVSLILADLAVQTEVRKLAEAFKEQRDRLDVLVNNAALIRSKATETPGGISWPSPRTT